MCAAVAVTAHLGSSSQAACAACRDSASCEGQVHIVQPPAGLAPAAASEAHIARSENFKRDIDKDQRETLSGPAGAAQQSNALSGPLWDNTKGATDRKARNADMLISSQRT